MIEGRKKTPAYHLHLLGVCSGSKPLLSEIGSALEAVKVLIR